MPRILWISLQGDVEVFRSISDAELYVEHYDASPNDLVVGADGAAFRPEVDRLKVRLVRRGDADWAQVRGRVAEVARRVHLDGDEEGELLFERVLNVYGFSW